MKLKTFERRTAGICKNKIGYQMARQLLTSKNPVRPAYYSGSGRFTTLLDYTDDTIQTLQRAGLVNGIDFVVENDAPKGSPRGNIVILRNKNKSIT